MLSLIECQELLGYYQCLICREKVEKVWDVIGNKVVEFRHKPPCFRHMTAENLTPLTQHIDGKTRMHTSFLVKVYPNQQPLREDKYRGVS